MTELQAKYNEMHAEGKSAWFDDGEEERLEIIKMGEPWDGLNVLEIGCGEGDLVVMASAAGASRVVGMDYSIEAVVRAKERNKPAMFVYGDYRTRQDGIKHDRIVMQGVLEHLDDPWGELKWIIDNLLKPGGDVVLSCPCFENLRGVIWRTLDLVGAVMSKTDKHYITTRMIYHFCAEHMFSFKSHTFDYNWAFGEKMIDDLRERIPKAMGDGGLNLSAVKWPDYIEWLAVDQNCAQGSGAIAVYKIQT